MTVEGQISTLSGILNPICFRTAKNCNNNTNNNNNNNIYLLQLGCNPVAVVMLHVHKT